MFCRTSKCIAAACAFAAVLVIAPGAEDSRRRLVLQLPFLHQFQFAGIYAAEMRGYFKEANLDVEVRPSGRERLRPLNEVLDGRAHIGVAPGVSLLVSRLQGQPLVLLAPIMQHSPLAIATREEENIRTPHDLANKRLALDKTAMESEIRLMLEREGVNYAQMQIVPNDWQVNELVEKTAEGMSTFIIDGPFYLAAQGVRVNLIRPVDYGIDFYGDCLFTSEETLRARHDDIAAARAAILRGWDYALKNPEEIIDWILENKPERTRFMTRAALEYESRRVAELMNADLVLVGHNNPGRWRVIAESVQPFFPGTNMARFEGFVYERPAPGIDVWLVRIAWGSLAVAFFAGLVVLANRRLKRLVEQRTRELRESESHYRVLFELSPIALVEFDYWPIKLWFDELRANGVVDLNEYFEKDAAAREEALKKSPLIEANPAALAAVGASSKEELLARSQEVMVDGTTAARLRSLVEMWEGKDHSDGEVPYRHLKTGEVRYFQFYWRMPREEDGRLSFRRTQTALLDTTERRQAEIALRESEERYRSLFDATPNPLWIYDLDSLEFMAVNDAAVRQYGYSRQEFLGMSILDIRPPEDVERLKSVIASYRGGHPHRNALWRHRRKDGSILYVEVYARTVTLNGVPGVLVLPFDLTAKIKSDEALRESEARYRTLFENAAGGVYRSTVEGRFISVNPALANMLGFATPDEMISWYSDRLDTEFYVRPRRREEFMVQLGARDSVTNFESEVRGKDVRAYWISENVRAVRDASGNILFFEGFVTDITPRRQLEAELQRASKLEAVGILAGGIAHDFNNILTVVLGSITMAEMDADPAGPVANLLREAKRATLRARDLTQQLLTFAKGGDPVRTTVALPELLRESAGFALHGSSCRAEFSLPENLWPANADKGQLSQVVQNLVINAVQAMPQGGAVRISALNVDRTGPVEVSGFPPGRYVKLSVVDSGIGIAADHLAKVFDPYFTTKQQGSGLGLATVYSIVRKHQGHIEVESTLGVGTTFNLWMPAADAVEVPPESKPDSLHPFHIRVLFMDDEPTIRHMAAKFMERIGVDCEMAADGAEAVSKYRTARKAGNPFDVVIMDLTVPGGMGGREAMEKLVELDPEVRAIVSSGYSRDPVLANYRKHGFKGILPKPYGLAQLRRALADTAGNHKQA